MKKKVAAILVATTMLATVLSGCGTANDTAGQNGGASADTSTEVVTESKTENNTEAEASSTENVEQEDTSAVQSLIDATEGTVELTVWASELQQDLTQELVDEFAVQYPEVDFNITIGACSESQAKDTVLTDVTAAADVYTFADDQINELVAAGALQPVLASYTYDVAGENLSGAVNAATVDGKLYAYPSTASNGYFMFYSKEYFKEEDVKTLDQMMKIAADNGKKITMQIDGSWYLYSFFKGAGLDTGLTEDGITNYCDWNKEGGTDVAQAILDICANPGFQSATDEEFQTGIAEGTIIAGVSGTWDAEAAAAAWGENYAAAKLPTYTVNGSQVQMSSYSGYKLIGVNPHSKFVGWSMLLAEYLTNQESQERRFATYQEGPANATAASSDAVKANPAIAALAAQAEFATPQRIGGNYWSSADTLGSILAAGNPDGTDLQELLDNTVAGITAPVSE